MYVNGRVKRVENFAFLYKITDSNENHTDYSVIYRKAVLSHFGSRLRNNLRVSPFLYAYKMSDHSAVVERTMTLGPYIN